MNKHSQFLRRFRMALLFAAFVFIIMLLSMTIVYCGMRLLTHFGIMDYPHSFHQPLLLFAVVCLIVGVAMSIIISTRPLKPWYVLTNAANEIANGNYDVRVTPKGPEAVQELFRSFNHMAEELGSVELLRTDFINNFSHEFKTPIVSIRGFAKMLKRDDLSDAEREEYIDIIISESERLSSLASNVLSLSKVEQQTILTNREEYNITEQIRLVIAMLMSKWSTKTVDIQFTGNEITINANKELLNQVWINLIDNAIKFSPDNDVVTINISTENHQLQFTCTNHGEHLSNDLTQHMFDKFYQGDTSHTEKGNGLGLTLCKKIVELHEGTIQTTLIDENTITITVELPL